MIPVLVPYRSDTPEREANWRRAQEQWHGLSIHCGDSDGEKFSRSQAINRAAQKAGEWEAAIVADSDLVLGRVAQAYQALSLAHDTRGYIVCFDVLYYLSEVTSRGVRAGVHPQPGMADEHVGFIWGGMFAIHRELWDATGGFNESYQSWGEEDGDFLERVNRHGVKDRVSGTCFHLKHPLVEGAR